jgi:hypothetical protein
VLCILVFRAIAGSPCAKNKKGLEAFALASNPSDDCADYAGFIAAGLNNALLPIGRKPSFGNNKRKRLRG